MEERENPSPEISSYLDHVSGAFRGGIDARLGSLDGQSKRVHHHHGVALNLALQNSHHLETASGHGMHDHLDQSHVANLDLSTGKEEKKNG